MQKLPIYLYSNNLNIQLDLDNSVREINNTMYQRELKIQKGIKNKVQFQLKNSDQKNIRIKKTAVLAGTATTATFTLTMVDSVGLEVGMSLVHNSINTGTYISAIAGNTVTLDNTDPQYDPFDDSFLSPILATLNSGTNLAFQHNFVFSMYDNDQQRLILQKNLELIDDGVTTSTKGLLLLELTENDLRTFNSSYFTFGITKIDADGTNIPAYSNTYYGVNGTIRMLNDIVPTLKNPGTVENFQRYANETTNLYEFYTGNLKSYPEQTKTTTVAMYMNNFTGTVYVQATLDNGPTTFGNYVTVATKSYNGYTGVDYANAVGLWQDVRVKWIPDPSTLPGLHNFYSPEMPGNPTPGTAYYPNGKIDKVLYRS